MHACGHDGHTAIAITAAEVLAARRAELPGTAPGRLGLCAHIDTAPQFTGTDVRPRLHEEYPGGVIDVGYGVVLDPRETHELSECIGDTIVTDAISEFLKQPPTKR